MNIICLDQFKGNVLVKFSISASTLGVGEGFGIHITDFTVICKITEKQILLRKKYLLKNIAIQFLRCFSCSLKNLYEGRLIQSIGSTLKYCDGCHGFRDVPPWSL